MTNSIKLFSQDKDEEEIEECCVDSTKCEIDEREDESIDCE